MEAERGGGGGGAKTPPQSCDGCEALGAVAGAAYGCRAEAGEAGDEADGVGRHGVGEDAA